MLKKSLFITASIAMAISTTAFFTPQAHSNATAALKLFKIENSHTSLIFRVKHKGLSYTYGRFNTVKGDVNFDKNNLAGSSINVTIDTASVDTNHKGRDKHLRNPDFFNASRYPKITFKSTKITATDKPDVYNLTGNLTLHGKTNQVTVKIHNMGQNAKVIGFDTNFSIKRSDYGMNKMLGGIGDQIDINFSFEAN